jgi:internalin A
VAEQLPDKAPAQVDIEPASHRLTPAQGAGLRAYRYLLFESDPARTFGSLQRIVTPSGDVLWVCPHHHREYEPGLPKLSVD